MKRYRVPLLIVLVALVVFVGLRVREATDGTYRTQRQLQQVPEEHLFHPGSAELRQFGDDRTNDITGQRIRANSAHILGTDATEEQVFAFYRERLRAQGWLESVNEVSLSTVDLRGIAFRKGTLLFQITLLRKNDARNGSAIDAYETPYTIALYADMPK